LTPAIVELEKELVYTIFQLGALLIRDGFGIYEALATGEEILQQMRSHTLKEIADRQLLGGMETYQTKFDPFCNTMEVLGLYNAMLKAHALNKLPPEPESEPEPEPEPESGSESSSSSSSSEESIQPQSQRQTEIGRGEIKRTTKSHSIHTSK
jgi:hypothetical protein